MRRAAWRQAWNALERDEMRGAIVGATLARLPWGEGEGGGYDGIWFRRDGHDRWQGELPALRKRRCRHDGGGRA